MIKKRNIALCILFSIITFGIYDIYWFIVMTNDSNTINPEEKTAGGGLAFLFVCITGIYYIYWCYKLGKKLNDSGTAYLLLALFGLGWLVPILAQSKINNHANA